MDRIRVGVIGLGFMGTTHLDVYARRRDVEVVAVADQDPARLRGRRRARGNIRGAARGAFDPSRARRYSDGLDLLSDDAVEVVDICVATPGHYDLATAALALGKHVLVEKPLCRTAREAWKLVDFARTAKAFATVAMCMRFWPGWTWLAEAIRSGRYGRVRSAAFRRLASHPGGRFYSSGKLSGGAILDLHLHDADFVRWCFGDPVAVTSHGYAKVTDAIDHVVTRYHFAGRDAPELVTAEGGWAFQAGFPFTMQYLVNFEAATAVYDLSRRRPLTLIQGGKEQTMRVPAGMGYAGEIAHFLDCVRRGVAPWLVTLEDGAAAIELVEAEARSVRTGRTVSLR